MKFLLGGGDGPPTAVRAPLFVASRGCSGCEFRTVCHDARQRVQDPVRAAGEHERCEWHVTLRPVMPREIRPVAPTRPRQVRVLRLFGYATRRVPAKVLR